MQSEFVPVPKDFKGYVIGKGGYSIQDIRQRSGARVWSPTGSEEEGFTVSGNAEQIAHAKRLILEKVQEKKRGTWEPVEIPDGYKGIIIGKGGANLREISKQTGAEVTRKHGEVHIINGTEEQREHVKVIIAMKVAYARLNRVENEFNKVKFYCFIDDCNLTENCNFKLEELQGGDRVVFPGSQTQYRLKPSEEIEPQDSLISDNGPSYLEQLSRAVLESLRTLKRKTGAEDYLEADMWCHFGRAIIRGPNEDEAAEGEWSIDDATKKFQSSAEGNYWKIAFNEGVEFFEDIFKTSYRQKVPEEYTDYDTRYDLTFLSPGCYQIRCKVWVAKEDTMKTLEDIPIPSSDIKNILEEIHFEDESTRSRCRGWLVLASRRYLQADILFPGCQFDCRFTVRGQTEITQFEADGILRRFTHENGRLIVRLSGYYYIYAQAFFETYTLGEYLHNRVTLTINGNEVSLMQTGLGPDRADYGSQFTGVIAILEKGDYLGLKTVYPCALWVSDAHTFFGAYRVYNLLS